MRVVQVRTAHPHGNHEVEHVAGIEELGFDAAYEGVGEQVAQPPDREQEPGKESPAPQLEAAQEVLPATQKCVKMCVCASALAMAALPLSTLDCLCKTRLWWTEGFVWWLPCTNLHTGIRATEK